MEAVIKPNQASRGTFFRSLWSALASLRVRSSNAIHIRGKKSEVLNAIYSSVLGSQSIEESIRATIRTFREHLTFTTVSITLFDFEKGTFTPYGFNDIEKDIILKDGASYPLNEMSSLSVLQKHKTYLVQDILKKSTVTPIEKNMMDEIGIRSYFLCPLVGKGELIGSLNFSSHLVNVFSNETISFCEEVAKSIALSLHQYHLQEKIKTINGILSKKEKEITYSIRYAKRIQQAKLPGEDQVRACAPDSFILSKPKDIVSGDFYYFRKNKGAAFIACADCTGHGVPGALMSMICSENLYETIMQNSDTSQILGQLNKKIKHSLQQSENHDSTRDGMDIALCNIDNNNLVKFAGANRPIWIIRKGQNVVEEIKGSKKAIGGFTEDNFDFETHWIKMHQGDTFYLSTDGYADTFGGKTNKKLMTKRFKEILLSIQHLAMEEQKEYLDRFIEEWKGEKEQVDDILVIGVRI